MLGTSERWIRDQARRRRIPHLRLGKGRILIRREDGPHILELFAVDTVPDQPDPLTVEEHAHLQADLMVIGLTERSRALHRRRWRRRAQSTGAGNRPDAGRAA